ncbi:MAG: helix-hairpin-helix domain-containing protein [Bacteroidales bacterium]|nr:helix-hairpin-helix domain-containing protein [Bacteroidales bacterium]
MKMLRRPAPKAGNDPEQTGGGLKGSFAIGAIALVFLVTGYQTALFVNRAAVMHAVAAAARPDTVFIRADSMDVPAAATPAPDIPRRSSRRSTEAKEAVRKFIPRKVESFRFDPNTVSVDDLVRLGFSPRQAQAIDNYRKKGGRFRRKSDFAKSYVVADSVYERLERWITIPRLDLNSADSAAFEALPGIGPWFASAMVSFRERLGGYSGTWQLLDIKNFGEDRYNSLKDLVEVRKTRPFPLWTAPEDVLSSHPYIGRHGAKGIILFRDNNPSREWTVGNIMKAGILPEEDARKLARCIIEAP